MDSIELPAETPVPASPRARAWSWHLSAIVALGGSLLAACGGSPTAQVEPGVPTGLKVSTIPTSAASRATMGNVVVQIVDGNGDPVDTVGIAVTVGLASGTTGTIGGTKTRTTAAGGLATFNNLTFTGLAGSKTLKFTASNLSQGTGTFALVAGPAAVLVANSSQAITAVISQAVSTKPAIKATDLDGNGVSGIAVTFAVTGGGGSATRLNPTTNASGIATVGSWTMGAAVGANTMTATAVGLSGSPLTFTATAGTTASNFTISIRYVISATPAEQAAVDAARARWESAITGDIGTFNFANFTIDPSCGGGTATSPIEDILIIVDTLDDLSGPPGGPGGDGPGGVLAAATPCYLRQSGSKLPFIGWIGVDPADFNNPALPEILTHEMAHVLGFGTLWEPISVWTLDFIVPHAPPDTLAFNGANAVNAFTTMNGGSGTTVPVEDVQGGVGTVRSHWKESIFKNELMTGFISGPTRPLSATSIASFADEGYVVNLSAADPFDLATASLRLPGPSLLAPVLLKDDIKRFPIRVVPGSNRRSQ